MMTNQTTPGALAARGRAFAKGNGGRRPGSKNKSSLILAGLLDGDKEELVRKGLELALAGDVVTLKFCLERTLPRERVITIDLPKMETADGAVDALATIMAAVCAGKITPGEGSHLAALVNSYARAIDIARSCQQDGRIRDADKRERIA
jgi:hypothetical protein